MEDKNLNLDNPIFVVYINCEMSSSQHRDELFERCREAFNYENATFWFIISDVSKIECVWDGKSKDTKPELSELLNKINKRLDIISMESEEFRKEIRDLKLSDVFE